MYDDQKFRIGQHLDITSGLVYRKEEEERCTQRAQDRGAFSPPNKEI